jgi:hypothetical protein
MPDPDRQPTELRLRARVRLMARVALVSAFAIVRSALHMLRRIGTGLLALIIIFEEWGWRPLAQLLGRLARLAPIAAIERAIMALPPYGALIVFAVPSLLLLPLKLLAVYLIAHGQTMAAAALFVGAKVAGTAIVARLFVITGPQLMRIAWFKRIYDVVMPWKTALTTWLRTTEVWQGLLHVKSAIKHWTGLLRQAARRRVAVAVLQWRRWRASR